MDQRRANRVGMIKAAQIKFGDVSLDCAAFDVSAVGVRIYLPAPTAIPEVVTLRLPDGAVRTARRVWQRDSQLGFEFLAADAD